MKSTPHNLVMSAVYDGRKGERPPVGNPTSIVCEDLMDAVGNVSFAFIRSWLAAGRYSAIGR